MNSTPALPSAHCRLPGAQELRDIDGMLDLLPEQRAALLDKLPTCGARTIEEVIARLAVVERLIWRDEHPEAHDRARMEPGGGGGDSTGPRRLP
jgi:hypothetical protein